MHFWQEIINKSTSFYNRNPLIRVIVVVLTTKKHKKSRVSWNDPRIPITICVKHDCVFFIFLSDILLSVFVLSVCYCCFLEFVVKQHELTPKGCLFCWLLAYLGFDKSILNNKWNLMTWKSINHYQMDHAIITFKINNGLISWKILANASKFF